MDINLVLSGGGARGLAHLGIIKGLRELGLSISKISGASSGAVIGAFISAGYSPEETLKVFVDNKLMYQIRPVFRSGIFRLTKWEKILLKCFPQNSFESLSIPLTVVATDINECKTDFFSAGELILPLLASCSVPGIFAPVLINERQYVDGGVLNNLPIDPFLEDAKKIVASNVNPLVFEKEIDSGFKIFERSIQLSIRESINMRKKNVHLFLEPEQLSRYQIFDLDEAEDIFLVGYAHALSKRKEIEKLLL